ncbi:hypothetical protein [Phreatobacter sp. AB_2022a]|uniref:hypothetical protein n=1 Tax=Phreatobacter sp. AB_2022a TaxID=3003134 RepID=UPI0022874B9B|nr:hypothetical protein [Phreatobacter sp. AB_2022a]MCZ0734333.1 hypothetical protein [Phreatobacter sp. AB_2022a]
MRAAGHRLCLFTADDREVSGVPPLPDTFRSCCAPPRWAGSVEAEAVDANVDAVSPGAGAAHLPPTDIPGIGRFAMVGSPQGGGFALFTPQVRHSARHPADGTGHVGGHELCSADWQSAPAFYGPSAGTRAMRSISDRSAPISCSRPAMCRSPACSTSLTAIARRSGSISTSPASTRARRLKEAGGQVLNGPLQVPGGDRIVQLRNPQGAMFALGGWRP